MMDLFSLTANMGNLEEGKLPPVEKWDPPHCGKMDMVIRRDGVWFHEGTPIGRAKLVRLFSTILKYQAGVYYLVTPVEKVEITVEDVPFIAVEMDVTFQEQQQQLSFRTNVGDHVVLDRDHALTFRPDPEHPNAGLVPYVMVRAGLEARLARTVYYQLAELAETDPRHAGRYIIQSKGAMFDFPAEENNE